MGKSKTRKYKRHYPLKHKPNTKKRRGIRGGGLIWDSNREKIIKRLLKIKAILPDQATEILNHAKRGSTKSEKIKLFVEKSISILLFNIFTIWKINGSKVKDTVFDKLSKVMQVAYSDDPKWQSDTLHTISTIYGTYSESNKKTIGELLDSGRDTKNSVAANGVLIAIYLLNENWIKGHSTLQNPNFDDLYRLWFNEKGEQYRSPYGPWW